MSFQEELASKLRELQKQASNELLYELSQKIIKATVAPVTR